MNQALDGFRILSVLVAHDERNDTSPDIAENTAKIPMNTDNPMQPTTRNPVLISTTPCGFISYGSFDYAQLCTGPMMSAEPQITEMSRSAKKRMLSIPIAEKAPIQMKPRGRMTEVPWWIDMACNRRDNCRGDNCWEDRKRGNRWLYPQV